MQRLPVPFPGLKSKKDVNTRWAVKKLGLLLFIKRAIATFVPLDTPGLCRQNAINNLFAPPISTNLYLRLHFDCGDGFRRK